MASPGSAVTAAEVNLALTNNVGPSTLGTSDFTATSGTTEKLLDTITVNVVSGRKYRVSYVFAWQADTLNGRYFVRIREGSALGGSQIAVVNMILLTPVNVLVPGIPLEAEWTAGSTGSQSFCATIQQNNGSGTATIRGASSQQRILSVKWLGQYA